MADDLAIYDCPFCFPSCERIFYESDLVRGIWDAFPVSDGHALLFPKRHVADWFGASREEKSALLDAIEAAKAEIEKLHRPDGYNIGINSGAAAGQTIFHLHVHVIPRRFGDVPDPRGGVRYVIPDKANYLSGVRDAGPMYDTKVKLLTTGEVDPLLPLLKEQLAGAHRVDIAVACDAEWCRAHLALFEGRSRSGR